MKLTIPGHRLFIARVKSTPLAAEAHAAAPSDAHLAPVVGKERIVLLDVIRGFTLYGVLLANTVPLYSGWGLLPKAERAARTGVIDEVAFVFLNVFISRKSQTLLTCLFGLGFAMQLVRAEARGERGASWFLRRLAALLLIGAAHTTFIWWGDVLWGYAFTGGALLLFRRQSYRALALWAFALVFLPKFLVLVPAVSALLERVVPSPADQAGSNAAFFQACRGHDYLHLVRMQAQRNFLYFWSHAPEYIPWMIGHFLAGYAAGRSRVIDHAAAHLPRWRRLLAWGLVLGALGGTVSAIKSYLVRHGTVVGTAWKMALVIPEEIGILAMALAYVAGLALLMQRPSWASRLQLLAPAGRMALTTYLSQSVIMTFIFYGWGLGLIGAVGPAGCVAITLGVFALQLALARAWLARFQFGPMEWLWRAMTYGRAPRMRRN
jgi:uncharacterized protein